MVLPLALRTHGEAAHGSLGAIVGHVGYDGESGSAVGAVDERISVAPVRWVAQLAQTVVTDADIRGDQSELPLGLLALLDGKGAVADGRQ